LLDARIGEVIPAGVLEARMATLLRNAALPGAEPEFTVTDENGGFVAVVDFAFPDRRLAIEVDGYEFHSSPRAIEYGHVRDRLLAAVSWLPLHYSWREVDGHDERVADEIRARLRDRRQFSAR
jgi:very-short-patch-repair endonuclease